MPTEQDQKSEKRRTKQKKEWKPPRIRTGKLFETSGVSCARQPGNPACQPGPTRS